MEILDIVDSDAQTFTEWKDEQEFEYHRRESRAVDYTNIVIDHRSLDNFVENDNTEDIVGWDNLFDELEIPTDSSESTAVKRHIESYVEAQGGDE